jgi:hypothetical protein
MTGTLEDRNPTSERGAEPARSAIFLVRLCLKDTVFN